MSFRNLDVLYYLTNSCILACSFKSNVWLSQKTITAMTILLFSEMMLHHLVIGPHCLKVIMLIWNVSIYLPTDMVSYPTWTESSATPLLKAQNFQFKNVCKYFQKLIKHNQGNYQVKNLIQEFSLEWNISVHCFNLKHNCNSQELTNFWIPKYEKHVTSNFFISVTLNIILTTVLMCANFWCRNSMFYLVTNIWRLCNLVWYTLHLHKQNMYGYKHCMKQVSYSLRTHNFR
jgi:hypothetical protein